MVFYDFCFALSFDFFLSVLSSSSLLLLLLLLISLLLLNCYRVIIIGLTKKRTIFVKNYSFVYFQAILGQVLFGEVVRSLWWMGTVLIISGLLLMHHASNIPPRKPGTRPKTH